MLGPKTIISRLLDLHSFGKLCFIGSRVYIMEFDEAKSLMKKTGRSEDLYPIRVEYNTAKSELLVCTRKDVRYVDLKRGKCLKIFSGIAKEEDEITSFRLV